jgi:nucleoside-triphosphatase THEP1
MGIWLRSLVLEWLSLMSGGKLLQTRLVIWTGDKHSGKTTAAGKLAQTTRGQGFNVAGILAPSLYRNGVLFGFDVYDLRTNARAVLARRSGSDGQTGPFVFLSDGLELGCNALSLNAASSADIVIVDEFGPLEINGDGWRKNVDLLVRSSEALIFLVVRQQLVQQVQSLYANAPNLVLSASALDSVDKVLLILKGRQQVHRIAK